MSGLQSEGDAVPAYISHSDRRSRRHRLLRTLLRHFFLAGLFATGAEAVRLPLHECIGRVEMMFSLPVKNGMRRC